MTSSGIFIMKFLLLMVIIQIFSRKNAESCSTYLSIVLMTAMISLYWHVNLIENDQGDIMTLGMSVTHFQKC